MFLYFTFLIILDFHYLFEFLNFFGTKTTLWAQSKLKTLVIPNNNNNKNDSEYNSSSPKAFLMSPIEFN